MMSAILSAIRSSGSCTSVVITKLTRSSIIRQANAVSSAFS
jgi:hypothetical protein